MTIGKLSNVNVREVWPNEANDFTPWLAENLEQLADAIGMPLHTEATEVEVGGFYADIVAVNPDTGKNVIIENQLEATDHKHLGQILTYLAGLDAETVIWIAPEFHSAHLSAIRWLNERTVEPTAFVAVRIRTIRIGEDTPVAPLFEVLEKPSNWERQLRVSVQKVAGPKDTVPVEFWAAYRQQHPDDGIRDGYAHTNVWHPVMDRDIVIGQYIAMRSVGIYIRSGWERSKEQVLEKAKMIHEPLQRELETTIWEPSNDDDWMYVNTLEMDTRDRANWPRMIEWLHDHLVKYRRAIATAETSATAS